jgi:hypothetical protein
LEGSARLADESLQRAPGEVSGDACSEVGKDG